MARVGRCQTVIIGKKIYNYGEIIPCLRWKSDDVIENEIWNAKIVSISGIRENSVSFDGEDVNGNFISISIDMDNVIDTIKQTPNFKTYAVTFLNLDNRKVLVDCFTTKSESGAVSDFHDCYRHGNYKVLSVAEVPEKQ